MLGFLKYLAHDKSKYGSVRHLLALVLVFGVARGPLVRKYSLGNVFLSFHGVPPGFPSTLHTKLDRRGQLGCWGRRFSGQGVAH